MGIQGLLSFLEKASRPVNISEFSGCTVAIDSYCWLHKGAFSCAEKLARGEKTDQYVNYCMKFVNMLLSYNIKPILVFDGRHLPAKSETEKKRREMREGNRKKAAELLRLGRDSEARSLIQRCVDVTHEMALALIKQCRSQGVDCIVAPYEADAQLAFLNLNGFAHIVITEDSDLMLFGCKLVLFKMDVYGNGVLVEQSKIPLTMKLHPNQFSMDKFRYMCILSGCDYLKSLPGIGLAKACKFIKKTQDSNISRALTRLGAYLNMPNLEVTQDYRDKFIDADAMFKYQPVFDPISRSVVPLNPLPADTTNPLVNLLDKEVCFQMALGNLNPFTLKQVDSWDPDQPQSIRTSSWKSNVHKHKSIWARDYKIPPPLPRKRDPREVEHKSTKGKTAIQPVSQISEKIAALPPKPSIEDELSRLRESFAVKPPPAKKQCFENTEENNEENEIHSCDSGILIDIEDKDKHKSNDILQGIIEKPQEQNEIDLEFTVDDIFTEQHSPIVVGGKYSRNPFSASSKSVRENPAKRSLGGALDMFSKLKKTQVEAACIVQSRYFSSEKSMDSVKDNVKSKEENKAEEDANLNETLLDIINATPSPKKRKSLPPKISSTTSPRRNIFMISDIVEADDKEKNIVSSPRSSSSTTPRKNIFSVSNTQENQPEGNFSPVSPKCQSFLKILDDVSKEMKQDDSELESSKSAKKLSSSSFKWKQPLLDCSKKQGTDLSLLGLYKPTSKHKLSPIAPSKSPKAKKGNTSSPKGRPGGLPEKLTFKKQSTDSNNGQKSILNMFAFQPKPKLKTQ